MRAMVGVGLLVLAALAGGAQAQPWQDLLAGPDWPWSAPQTPHPAVARVTVPQREGVTALGSGTLVDVNDKLGLVITNWHVVDGAAGEISVTFPDGFRALQAAGPLGSCWPPRPTAWPVNRRTAL